MPYVPNTLVNSFSERKIIFCWLMQSFDEIKLRPEKTILILIKTFLFVKESSCETTQKLVIGEALDM